MWANYSLICSNAGRRRAAGGLGRSFEGRRGDPWRALGAGSVAGSCSVIKQQFSPINNCVREGTGVPGCPEPPVGHLAAGAGGSGDSLSSSLNEGPAFLSPKRSLAVQVPLLARPIRPSDEKGRRGELLPAPAWVLLTGREFWVHSERVRCGGRTPVRVER